MRLALALTSAQADRLRKEADRLGIAPAVLARATLEDLCDLPDAGFRAAAERIVPKHQELSLASPDAVSDACRDPRAAPRDAGAVLPSSSVGEESLSPNHPDTSSRF